MDSGDRAQLFNELSHLSQTDFERLLIAVDMPRMNRAGNSAKIGEQVSALLEWADSYVGPGLEAIADTLKTLSHDVAGWDAYLQAITTQYEKWWDIYPLTDAISAQQTTFTFEQTAQTEERSKEDPTKKETVLLPQLLQGIIDYAESEPVLLVGAPGAGKSTTLLRLLATLAKQELQKAASRIPVLVRLKDYQLSLATSEDPSGMLTLIQEALEPELSLDLSKIKALLFQEKRLFLLLDGLNEIPADVVRSKLTSFRDQCKRAKIPLIFTTRNLGDDFGIQRRVNLQFLSPTEINRFLSECMPGQEQQALQLLNRGNQDFNKTPFILWMLYDVSRKSGQIPESLGEAFKRFTENYTNYKINQEGIPHPPNTLDYWSFALEYLAFKMLNTPDPQDPGLIISERQALNILIQLQSQKGIDSVQAKALLKSLLKYHLLQKSHKDEISFCHQLIQEYYAAEHLLRLLPELGDEQLKRDYLNLLKWTEPIALMLALMDDESQALRVVNLAMDGVDLMLGAKLAGDLKPNSQRQIIEEIIKFSLASKSLKVELLGLTQSNLALPHLLPYLGSDDFDLQYTLSKALKRINSVDLVTALTKLINDQNSMIRIASIAALTNTPSKEVVQALKQALRHDSPETRWSAAEALGNIGNLDAEEDLILALSDPSPNVVRQAASALGKLASEKSACLIFQKLQESGSIDSIYFAYSLAEIGSSKVITSLIKLYVDSERMDFIIAAIENFEIPNEAISIILEALTLGYKTTRINAILAAGQLNIKLAIPPLMALVVNEDPEIQEAAIEALGKLKAFEAKDLLIEKLEEKNYWTVTTQAAIAVGHLNAKEAIPKLISLLHDKKYPVREDILYALSLMNDIEAWEGILDMLEDESIHMRRIAVSTLKSSNLEEVSSDSRLLLILRSENNELTIADALEILGKSKFDSKLSILEGFLDNPDSIIRRGAINGLRISLERKAVDILRGKIICKSIDNFSAVSDDEFTLLDAAYAVGEIGDYKDLPFLIQAFKKTGKECFLEAISSIQIRCKFYNYGIWQEAVTAQNMAKEPREAKTVAVSNIFPNATEVKIIERVEHYHENPPGSDK